MKINVIHSDVRDFLNNLDDRSHAETFGILELLEQEGYEIRMPFSKKVLKGVYELRIKSSQNIRIFYTFHNNEVFLLHAIIKDKQKLPKRDIQTVTKRLLWLP